MGSYWAKVKQIDSDDLFSYNTNKVVQVRDRRLGLLYLGFLFCIVLYIVFYNLLYEKKYMAVDIPAGSFRLSLMQAPKPRNLSDLPYCQQTNETYEGFPNYPCMYYNEDLVVYPLTEESAMLAATRITEQELFIDCNFSQPGCQFQNSTPPSTVFVADIEHFTLMIDHALYSPVLGIQANAKTLNGKLVNMKNEAMDLQPPNQVGVVGQYDIIELGVLLQAAGTDTLDMTDEPGPDAESLRYAGTMLMVLLEYSNLVSFNSSYIEYTISVRRVLQTEFKAEEFQYSHFPTTCTYWNRHGIRMLFLRTGTIGKFDFQTMLINIIAGAALLSLVTYIVDFLAKYTLPERELYRAYMIQPTEDFGDLRDVEKMKLIGEGNPEHSFEREDLGYDKLQN
jgi:hypothetical protein